MSEEVATATGAEPVVRAEKWVGGLSAQPTVGEVAGRVLQARLQSVWHWLPLAAEQAEQNPEHVRRLRVTARRAARAVRVFVGVLPEGMADDVGVLLRRILQAADEVRTWDSLRNQFLRCEGDSGTGTILGFIERLQAERSAAQVRLATLHQELAAAGLAQKFDEVIAGAAEHAPRKAQRKFGRRAKRYLKPAAREFFAAAARDLTGDLAVRELRLRTQDLRYTMEIVAVAFDPAFRQKLYPRLGQLQDLIGALDDHAAARDHFRLWLAQTPERERQSFLEGMLLAEAQACHDLRKAFLACWSPEAVNKLRRQFRLYCGLD